MNPIVVFQEDKIGTIHGIASWSQYLTVFGKFQMFLNDFGRMKVRVSPSCWLRIVRKGKSIYDNQISNGKFEGEVQIDEIRVKTGDMILMVIPEHGSFHLSRELYEVSRNVDLDTDAFTVVKNVTTIFAQKPYTVLAAQIRDTDDKNVYHSLIKLQTDKPKRSLFLSKIIQKAKL